MVLSTMAEFGDEQGRMESFAIRNLKDMCEGSLFVAQRTASPPERECVGRVFRPVARILAHL